MIITFLGGIRATIFAALAGLLLMVAAVQHAEVRHYKASAVTLKSAVSTFAGAQTTNLATIAALQAANKQWADKSASDTVAANKAAQASKAYTDSLQQAAEAAQKALQHAYANHPDAKAWAGVVVPDSVVRVLAGSGTH